MNFKAVKVYLVKSFREQDSGSLNAIFLFNTQAVLNKYFPTTGSTAAGKAAIKKLNDKLGKEMEK